MLHLFASNALELLFERYLQLTQSVQTSPLAPTQTIVGNQGVGIWLTQQQALRCGIAANQSYPLPGRFIGQLIEAHFEVDSRLEKAHIQWLIYAALAELVEEPAFAPVAHYLGDDDNCLRRLQLSEKIADVFDQYLVYRPELLHAWENGLERPEGQPPHPSQAWQSRLWQHVVQSVGQSHRANLTLALIDKGQQQQLDPRALPEQLVVFNPGAMAPVHLRVLDAIAHQIPVHFLFQNPCCDTYWLDVEPPKRLARRHQQWLARGKAPEAGYFSEGNPLLGSFAQQGKHQLQCLYELPQLQEDNLPLEISDPQTLLQCIQRDISELRLPDDTETTAKRQDRSLHIHSCHSAVRELQVLHDEILDALEADPELAPHQILVMVPDIDRYAPLIDAVFGAVPEARRLLWHVADRTHENTHPLYHTLVTLLRLGQSRFTVSEVLSLLRVPALARRFGLEDPETLNQLQTWVQRSGIRWGLDAQQRDNTDAYPRSEHSWQFGLQRLYYGYALADDKQLVHQVRPYAEIEGSDSEALGRLTELLKHLQRFERRFRQSLTLRTWADELTTLIETLLEPEPQDEAPLQQLRRAANELVVHAGDCADSETFTADLYTDLLMQSLNQGQTDQSFLRGGITFCSTTPMRAIPFSMIALLGLNDGEFPRQQHPPSFDLMAAQPRQGDRSRRDDDRYLFLEAILAAQSRLHLSYIGRSQKDNAERQPSSLLAELRDYVVKHYADLPDVMTEHTLQAFDARNFEVSKARSFAEEWCPPQSLPNSAKLAESPANDEPLFLDIDSWLKYWQNPIEAYAKAHLGLDWRQNNWEEHNDELFQLDNLQRYTLRNECLKLMLQQLPDKEIEYLLQQSALLPHGHWGKRLCRDTLNALKPLSEQLQAVQAHQQEPSWCAIDLQQDRIQGQLMLSQSALTNWHVSSLKEKHKWRFWLTHLLHCANHNVSTDSRFFYLKDQKEKVFELKALSPNEAKTHLSDLLALYRSGQRQPLCFLPEVAWHLCHDNRAEAEKDWQIYAQKPPQRALADDLPPPLGVQASALAKRLMHPLLDTLKQNDAEGAE